MELLMRPTSADLIITTSDFADALRDNSVPIIRIDNMMDKAYLKEQLMQHINQMEG